MGETAAIRDVLRRVTAAWREGRLEELYQLFRPDVMFVQPGLAERLEGVEACVGSYQRFLEMATVQDYREEPATIDVAGDVAVATVPFAIDYEVETGRFQESGHDLVVLVREGEAWRVQWRTLIPAPPPV